MAITLDTTFVSTDYSLRNRNYQIIIRQDNDADKDVPDPPTVVVGAVSTEFQMSHAAPWEPLWNQVAAGDGAMSAITKVMQGVGVRLVPQVGTMLVYNGGGNDSEFSLEFELFAWSDPEKDVMQAIRTLYGMTVPSLTDKGFMRSPGAYIDGGAVVDLLLSVTKGDAKSVLTKVEVEKNMRRKCSISIGRWLYFDNVAITNVQYNLHTDTPFRGLGSDYINGDPNVPTKWEGQVTGANVTLTFKTMFTITQEDIEKIMIYSDGRASAKPAHEQILTREDLNGQSPGGNSFLIDNQMELIDLFDPLAT